MNSAAPTSANACALYRGLCVYVKPFQVAPVPLIHMRFIRNWSDWSQHAGDSLQHRRRQPVRRRGQSEGRRITESAREDILLLPPGRDWKIIFSSEEGA